MANSPTNRRLLWILSLCAMSAVGLWMTLRQSSRSIQESAEPAERTDSPHLTDIAAVGGFEPGSDTRRQSASNEEAPQDDSRRSQLLRAIQGLSDLPRQMPPNSSQYDFEGCDMSPLRKLVLEMRVEARELRGLLDSAYGVESNRSLVLAAFAFAKDVRGEDREFLLAAVRTGLGEKAIARDDLESRSRDASAFAGLFSLRMHGAEDEIEAVAEVLLERLPDPAARGHESLRNLTLFALSGVDDGISEATLTSLRSITARPTVGLLTSGAWRSLARSGRPDDLAALMQAAESENGPAREGLEGAHDPALIPTLGHLAAASDRSVYGGYLAASAARAMLSIDSDESLAAFESVCLSQDSRVREAGSRALALNPPTTAATVLLRVSVRARTIQSDHEMLPAVDGAMQRIRERLRHATVPHQEVQECLIGVRETLPEFVLDPQALRSALEILALGGDDEDRSRILIHLESLPQADRDLVLETWASRRPRNPLR